MSKRKSKKKIIKCNDPRFKQNPSCRVNPRKVGGRNRSGVVKNHSDAAVRQVELNFTKGINYQRPETLLMKYSLAIILFTTLVTIIEYWAHVNDTDELGKQFATYNLYYFFFVISFFPYWGISYTPLLAKVKLADPQEFGGWGPIAIQCFVCIIATALVQIIIGLLIEPVKYSVSDIELYLFYVNSAIAEEVLFRNTIQGVLENIFTNRSKTKYVIIGRLFAIAVTATLFAWFHVGVYGQDIFLMISVLLGGVIFGLFYAMTGNLFIVIVGHIANNMVAVFSSDIVTGVNSIFQIGVAPMTKESLIFSLCLLIVVFFSKKINNGSTTELKGKWSEFYNEHKYKIWLIILSILTVIVVATAVLTDAYKDYRTIFGP